MPRVVLITNDSQPGQRILRALHEQGVRPYAVLFINGPLGPPKLRGAGMVRRLLRWPRSLASGVVRRGRYHRRRRASYLALSDQVIPVGAMNGRAMQRALDRLRPDLLLLGGGGILAARTIAKARLGVLNAHPALLPWVRGCGVQGHSLEQGIALGASLHWVDAGIDTGAVLERRLLEIEEEPSSAAELQWRADELGARMLAEVVAGIVAGGELPAGVPQPSRYPLFRWPAGEALAAHLALAEGPLPRALFERWRPLCADAERLSLPPGEVTPPLGLEVVPIRK